MYIYTEETNDKDPDQTAQVRRLICLFVVRNIWYEQVPRGAGHFIFLFFDNTLQNRFTCTHNETRICNTNMFIC